MQATSSRLPLSLLLVRVLSLGWAFAVALPSAWLWHRAVTTPGTLFGIAALLLGAAPLSSWARQDRRWLRRSGWLAVAAWAAITTWIWMYSPDGHPRPGSRVQNRYSDQGWHYQRLALGALLPEVDQLLMGVPLIPLADRLFTSKQAETMCSEVRTIYGAMEADPDFHALGSIMPDVYGHLLLGPPSRGHYFLYIPPDLDRSRPAPAFVFLHGTGGNFKAYTWILSRLADKLGMVLIVPSNGMGTWTKSRGVPSVIAALDDAARLVSLDRDNIHLAGLSSGGLGVSRLAASASANRFRSLIFLSPVFDQPVLDSAQSRDKPVLIISGQEDDRIPIDYVRRHAQEIRNTGASVDLIEYPGADHLLVFTHRDRLLAQLSEWLVRGRRQP